MRLYLSSFKIGNRPEKLLELAGTGRNAVVILNALDHKPEVRERFCAEETKVLQDLGFAVEELDLRQYFGKATELEGFLRTKDMVWINGGNTFLLRRAMKQSGFDEVITKLLHEDVIVYAGFSAAAVVLHKDLHGLELTDNPNKLAEGYDEATPWDGLGLLDYSLVVHYDSDHAESASASEELASYQEKGVPYKTLRDGEVLVINGSEDEIVG